MTAFYARIKGLHQNVKIKEIKQYLAPIRPLDVKVLKNGCGRIVFKTEKDLKRSAKKSGKIHGKDVHIVSWPKKVQESKIAGEPTKPSWPVRSVEEMKTSILESGRLFVRNLSYDCTEDQLEKLFSKFGSLSDIHLSYDPVNHASRGFAFITYMFPAEAVIAFSELDKTKFQGRLLHILPAEEAPESYRKPTKEGDADSCVEAHRSSFQVARLQTLKTTAGAAHNWNALFIRPDAVATYLAAKFGLTKEQVLNPTERGGSVAVRLAHAEAQLVTEMRDFLQQQGLELNAFEEQGPDGSGRRDRLEAQSSSTLRQVSGTAFLIKNLPVGTTEVEVRELIARLTNPRARAESDSRDPIRPRKVIVPPLGITAIVVFALPQHARLAYRLLAYEPYQDNVLYLQWLPHGAFRADADTKPAAKEDGENPTECIVRPRKRERKLTESNVEVTGCKEPVDAEAEFEAITALPDDESHQITASKKRLTFSNSDAEEDFDEDGNAHSTQSIRFKTKNGKKKKQKVRNYDNKKTRLRRQEAQDEEVDTSIKTELAETPSATKKPTQNQEPKPTKPVLLVRNIPFQAKQEELTELFGPVGGLLRVRLPKKPTGGHRGFGFVEFSTIDQANIAKDTLGEDTHFLGRRLQIEFARG